MSGISFDEFDPENVGGFDRVAAGAYHAQVVKIDPDGGKGGAMLVDFEIMAGTDPSQIGKVHQERFSADLKKMPQKKRAALAFATGIVTVEEAKAAKAEKREIIPDWSKAEGKQVCLVLAESENGGKTYINLNYDEIWSPTDKKAYHVPLNPGMLARAGIKLPEDRPVGGVKAPPKEAKAAATTTATPDDLLKGVV